MVEESQLISGVFIKNGDDIDIAALPYKVK